MGWDILKRAIDVIHFVVLVLMVSILFLNNNTSEQVATYGLKMESLKEDVLKVISNNTSYLETRQNRIDAKQDNYQNTSSTQISLLSQRVEKLEKAYKNDAKIINTNTNNVLVNTKDQQKQVQEALEEP